MHHVVAEVGEFLREAQFRLAAPQLLLGLLARGDVVQEADEPRRLHSAHLADGQIARDFAAVLATRPDFAPLADHATLARFHVPAHVAVVRALVRLGHQHGDVSADHFLGRVAEQLLGSLAEFLDRAAVIDDDDGVDGRVEDGAILEPLLGTGPARCRAADGLGVLGRHLERVPESEPAMLSEPGRQD
jgi:hypothetical protein